jgi:hypothetical protein
VTKRRDDSSEDGEGLKLRDPSVSVLQAPLSQAPPDAPHWSASKQNQLTSNRAVRPCESIVPHERTGSVAPSPLLR